jgi:hypothetical protein
MKAKHQHNWKFQINPTLHMCECGTLRKIKGEETHYWTAENGWRKENENSVSRTQKPKAKK